MQVGSFVRRRSIDQKLGLVEKMWKASTTEWAVTVLFHDGSRGNYNTNSLEVICK